MPNTFEEAGAATREMFENDGQLSLADVPTNEEQLTETSTQAPAETPTTANTNQTALDEASQTAEIAAQVAAEKDNQLQQTLQRVETLEQHNAQLQETVEELSNRNMQNMAEDAMTAPSLDINSLAFADEETIRAAQEKYASDMSEFTRKQIMKELEPVLKYAKDGMYEKEKTEAVSALSHIPQLSGIKEMLPELDNVIANNKYLQSEDMPIEEKLINAYLLANGINSVNAPPPEPKKEPTTEELLELYNNNPAFQELVEKQRLEQIKQSQQVPTFSASSGAVNAALNIKEKPQTFEEASRRTREMFGM